MTGRTLSAWAMVSSTPRSCSLSLAASDGTISPSSSACARLFWAFLRAERRPLAPSTMEPRSWSASCISLRYSSALRRSRKQQGDIRGVPCVPAVPPGARWGGARKRLHDMWQTDHDPGVPHLAAAAAASSARSESFSSMDDGMVTGGRGAAPEGLHLPVEQAPSDHDGSTCSTPAGFRNAPHSQRPSFRSRRLCGDKVAGQVCFVFPRPGHPSGAVKPGRGSHAPGGQSSLRPSRNLEPKVFMSRCSLSQLMMV